MTQGRYYADIKTLKTCDINEANDLLKEDWELLAVKEESNEDLTRVVFVLGR